MATRTPSSTAADTLSTRRIDGRAPLTLRDAVHLLIAAATWALFFYWWALVLPQVGRDDAVTAALFIAVSAVATAVLTAMWVRYNIDIYRRKGPRLQLTPAAPQQESDALGRKIVGADDGSVRAAQTVVVAVDGDRKTFDAGGDR